MAQGYKPADGTSSPERPDFSADTIFEQSVQLQPVKQPADGSWGACLFMSGLQGLATRHMVIRLCKAGRKPFPWACVLL